MRLVHTEEPTTQRNELDDERQAVATEAGLSVTNAVGLEPQVVAAVDADSKLDLTYRARNVTDVLS
jgi:hypothetical protein